MTSKKKTIGILGGMGPVASADTYTQLIKICQQKYSAVQDYDYPTVILYSLPLEDFTHEGFSENSPEQESVVTQLTIALKKLASIGSDVIIIDCNTVHYFFDRLEKSTLVPIINLIQRTVDHIQSKGYKKVGLLCSQASKDVELYTKPLNNINVEVLNTTKEEQDLVNDVILAVMSGTISASHIGGMNELIDRLNSAGAECILLGCTEISHMARQLTHKAVFVDSEELAIEEALSITYTV